MKLQGGEAYDWDEENRAHAQRRGFAVEDVEAALADSYGVEFPATNTDDEERYGWIGMTRNGVVLVIIYTFRGELVRPFSARRATSRERRLYTEAP